MAEANFMYLIISIIVVFAGYLILRNYIKESSLKTLFNLSDFISKDLFKEIINSKEMVKRIPFTLLILIIFRLVSLVPLPGINIENLKDSFPKTLFWSNFFSQPRMLFLGVMPYISACILLQVLSIFIYPIRRYMFEDREGRKKLVRNTLILSILISIFQAYFTSAWMDNHLHFRGVNILLFSGLKFRLLVTLSMVAGFLFSIWLANLITKKGIGNGIPMLILSGIIVRIIALFVQVLKSRTDFIKLLMFLFIFIFWTAIILLITKPIKKISLVSGTGTKKETLLPFRISWLATMPIVFAQIVILLPISIVGFIPNLNPMVRRLTQLFTGGSLLYYLVYVLLIIIFTYLYLNVVFKSEFLLKLFKRYNCAILKVKMEDKTEDYISNSIRELTLLTGSFLVLLAIVTDLIMRIFKFPYFMVSILGSGGLLIAIGIFYDFIEQIKSRLVMEKTNIQRQYIIAVDELDANIKKSFLESQGIPCVIEALRYTWGMPIRTAIDEYKLYIPQEQFKRAEEILKTSL